MSTAAEMPTADDLEKMKRSLNFMSGESTNLQTSKREQRRVDGGE